MLIFKNLLSHPCLSPAERVKELTNLKCLPTRPDDYNVAYFTHTLCCISDVFRSAAFVNQTECINADLLIGYDWSHPAVITVNL